MATPALDWPELREYRDWMVGHLDDAGQVGGYEHAGATVIKGAARLAGPGRAEADGELLEADHVVIATGSEPVRPDIDGLDGIEVWTNREATTTADIPGRVLLVGGGAVGGGVRPVLRGDGRAGHHRPARGHADRRGRPAGRRAGRDALAGEGVTVHTGRTVARARPASAGHRRAATGRRGSRDHR